MISKKNASIVLLMIASLAVVLVASACGGQETTTVSGAANASGAAGSDFQTYTDPTYGFSFQYPNAWELSDQASVDATGGGSSTSQILAYDPDGAASSDGTYVDLLMVTTYRLNVTITDDDIPALESELQGLVDGLTGQGTNAEVTSPLAQTELNGLKGYTTMFSFDKEGVPCTSKLYFLFKDDVEYMVTVQAADQNWEADQAIFNTMVGSFTVK